MQWTKSTDAKKLIYQATGKNNSYQIELDKKIDRYVATRLAIIEHYPEGKKVKGSDVPVFFKFDDTGWVKIEGQDAEGSFYLLKDAKAACLALEPAEVQGQSDSSGQDTIWFKNDHRGYDTESDSLIYSIRLDKKEDRYFILTERPKPENAGDDWDPGLSTILSADGSTALIYSMRDAKKVVLDLMSGKIMTGSVDPNLTHKDGVPPKVTTPENSTTA